MDINTPDSTANGTEVPKPPDNLPKPYIPPQPYNPNSQGSAGTGAILSLVFGILSYFICPLAFGIVAWVMGNNELNSIAMGKSSQSGEGMAKAGKWLGIINVIISVAIPIAYLLFLAAIFVFGLLGIIAAGS